ncbi:MAG TPA: BrnT family toxin [Xanthobacteraceae bacterium]
MLVAEDTRRNYGDRRFIALGEYDGEVIRLVFTERDRNIRIISAWKASRNDRKNYQKARPHRQI